MAIKLPILFRYIYALCLTGAAWTHIQTVVVHGLFWDYGGVPIFSRIYWTSLTFFDPAAAVLLILRPRVGVVLTVAIIVSDVAHNTWLISRSLAPNWSNWMYVSQVAFLVFVLLTVTRAWTVTTPQSKASHSFDAGATGLARRRLDR